ncbi:putative nuclease HARBI1 [Haliotis rubra]|uniref:putative nuclease HARBI1 n=1 Tax=Haliotis rubra TaxID=36100 RepID=UPI001EE60737|nr:putative nuclease HARBI1 [Haliotis rubra]
MASFRTFHRLYILFSDLMGDDEENYALFLSKLRQWGVVASIPRSVPKAVDYTDIFAELSVNDDYFSEHFRVSRHTFDILLEYIEPSISRHNRGGNHPVPPEKQLYIFLWYLSNLCSMREVSQLFDVSMSTVHKVVTNTSKVIASLQNRMIRWPDEQRRAEIAATVQQNSGFPGVVGFLDGTHIRLSSPIGQDRDYYNRKGYPSMQLQLAVDHELQIISAYTGWPGCCHDARVLRNSMIYQKAERGQLFSNAQHLFADNAYPLRNWLITPFRCVGNITRQQRRFNKRFSGQRQTVERAIGHLKGRFRRLREIPFHNADDVCHMIIAACVCHNICVLADDDVEHFMDNDGLLHPNNYQKTFTRMVTMV